MEPITAIIVDDHFIFRKGLRLLLEELNFVEVIGEASNGIEFLELLKKIKPDIVFMDVKMPKMNGIEATKKALEKYSDLIIVALTMHDEDYYVKSMFDAGSKGFILKNVTKEELENALETLLDGKSYYYSNSVSSVMINHYLDSAVTKVVKVTIDPKQVKKIHLSLRKIEILKMICEGYNDYDIAEKLGLSVRTIQGHKYRLYKKTGLKNTTSLISYAVQHRLIKM